MKIEIISSELIKPSSPTPSESRDFKLSVIDERIPPAYIPLVLYYSCDESKNMKQSEILDRLKKSLSDALVRFYPLAGRMDGQISVSCNDEGALYLEAKVDGKISDIIEFPEVEFLDKLIPYQSKGSITNAVELIAIQVSLFSCGGISIGICISHRIADGWTLCSFIKGWSSMACAKYEFARPVFNSSALFPPRNTPDFKPNIRSLAIQPPVIHLVTKRFVFNESVINALKSQVVNNSSIVNPTRVEVVSAFLWKACIFARKIEKSGKSVAFHPVNLRGRVPALTDDTFGNIFQMTSAVNSDETDWIHLVEKLRAAFKKISSDYINELLGENGFELVKNNFIQISKLLGQGDCEIFRFNSYCRFPLYETDFGWGKPVWVSASFSTRDSIFMLDSKSSGGIEAWIVMAEDDMKKLEQEISIELQAFV
ncbi:vinorine synthase-like [Olea europaea subsp. europaea]|uniref:Vinorine synthase-like n=1 Tax=Olea europaea subsp. europaea TaxID=158383 RepID=A0A8S0UPP0_OLEEU|nr:vinorine synthase-like [Olea europaea subsp. europaea]